jgi:hypothetical protein
MKRTLIALFVVLASLAIRAQTTVTVFEGARVIVGDGRPPIENATIVVNGARIAQVGRDVKAPAGATRVSLTGKTVMPAIVDTHTHLSQTKEALAADLTRRAYYGVSAAMSLGQDTGDLAFKMREESKTMPARHGSSPPDAASPRLSRGARRRRTGFSPPPKGARRWTSSRCRRSTSSRSGSTIGTGSTRSSRRSSMVR